MSSLLYPAVDRSVLLFRGYRTGEGLVSPPLFMAVGFSRCRWHKHFRRPPLEDEVLEEVLFLWHDTPGSPMSHSPQSSHRRVAGLP